MLRAGVFGNSIVIETDDYSVKSLLEYQYVDRKYNFFIKKWCNQTIKGKIYDKKHTDKDTGHLFFQIGIGFAGYLINVLKPFLPVDDYDQIVESMRRQVYRTIPFKELRDYQNDDVLHLLKHKFGLFSCPTSYGKTQVISVLANYFYTDEKKKVLLVAPGKKARDELVKRIYNLYGIEVSTKFGHSGLQAVITNGILNKKELKNPESAQKWVEELNSFDVVLCDEVEYCINDGGKWIFDNCTGAEYRFGFSGTADKSSAQMISFHGGLNNKNVAENRDLIKYFGSSVIYKLPIEYEIDLISVKTVALDTLIFEESDFEGGNVYTNILTRIWTDDSVCKVVVNLVKTYPKLFIPINNLQGVINEWIDKWFLGQFRILLISHEGYVYYDLNGNKSNLSLQEASEYIEKGLVDVIPSTSSGYRALSFDSLENIFLIQGNIAGVVLQCIGRVARGNHMNIISLDSMFGKKIPVYTKGQEERDTMIKNYYKYCEIKESKVLESNLKGYIKPEDGGFRLF